MIEFTGLSSRLFHSVLVRLQLHRLILRIVYMTQAAVDRNVKEKTNEQIMLFYLCTQAYI